MNNSILLLKKKKEIYKNNNRIPKSSNVGDNRIIHCAPYEACTAAHVQSNVLLTFAISCPPPKTDKTFYMLYEGGRK